MAMGDALKGFYGSLEDRYYSFLDWLDSHHIPVYSVVDAIESANIPSFPVFIILVVLVLAGIFWLVLGTSLLAGESTFALTVLDNQGNPIPNAVVSISFGNQSPISNPTNTDGKLEKKFPRGTELSVTVSKESFENQTFSITLSENREEKTVNLVAILQTITKTVNLLDSTTNALYTKPVGLKFWCSNNSSFLFETTTSTGSVTVANIPLDCGTLFVSSRTTGVTFSGQSINYQEGGIASLSVSEEAIETGTVRVTVKDSAGNGIQGINVKLMRSNGTQFTQRNSSQTGVAVFEQVPVGSYYFFTSDFSNVPQRYADYDSSVDNDIKQLSPNATIEFTAILREVVFGKIRILASDALTGAPIANATATLISSSNVEITSKSTDMDGFVEFPISDVSAFYSVRLDHLSYLIATLSNLLASDATIQARLQPATGDKITSLTVIVLDPNGFPVENAKVQLKKNSDGSIASEVLATGVDGKATFLRLVPDTYFAFVFKEGFDGISSSPVTVLERQPNSVTVVLPIGSGTIVVAVLDESLQPVSNANVRMRDYFLGNELEEGLNDSGGQKSFVVRADKKVFFEIQSNEYAAYTTIPYSAPVDSTREVTVQLTRDIVRLEARFLGFYSGEEKATDSLSAGQRYAAKLLLMVPESAEWEEAGIHIRTGTSENNQANLMESDYLYLGNAKTSANNVVRGKSYSPPAGFAEDSKHLTTGNSKWLNAVFSRPTGGVYELETEVQVLDQTPIGSLLPFSYRAWGKSNASFVRFPIDRELGNNSSTSTKQALYATTNDHYFTLGPTTLCNDQFCYIFVVQDLQSNTRSVVTDSFPARISSDYKFFFTLVNKSALLYSNAELVVENAENGLAFREYEITDSSGQSTSGNADGKKVLAQTVSDVGMDSTVFGELAFSTEKEGSNSLAVKIRSNQQTVLEKTVHIEVEAAKDLNLNILPKTLVPFLDNDLIIQTADTNSGNGIPNSTIEIFINNELAVSGNTDGQGIFKYTLQSPAPGWIVKVVAKKTGYASQTKELKVSSNILTIIPDSVSETLTVSGIYGFEKDFIAINHSVLPLTITQAVFSNEFGSLVKAEFETELANTVLEPGRDTNFLVQVELTDKAKRLLKPADVKGTMTLFTANAEFNQTWANSVPFSIHIGFGGEVDDQNCLVVQPGTWTVSTSNLKSQTLEVKVSNKCKVDSSPVALQDIQARIQISGTDNALGEFTLSNDFPGNKTITVRNEFQSIANEIPANADPILIIVFTPNASIKSGSFKATLIIQGLHTANNGIQPIATGIGMDLTVNDLSKCIEVKPTNVIVYSTPPGIGYGMYSQYGYGGYGYGGIGGSGGYDPYSSGSQYGTYSGSPYGQGGYQTGYNRFDTSGNYNNYYNNYLAGTQSIDGNPTLVDYPERLYATNYPYAGYSEPFYDTWAPYASNGTVPGYNGYQGASANYYGQQFGNFNYANSFYGRNNQFRVTNSCSAAVEVSFEPDPALIVQNSKITIEPDTVATVPVESTYYYGIYPLNVKAKLANSHDKSQLISTVNVNVMPADDASQYDNCIRLSTTKFKFNDFIQKPVRAKVYNSCYAQGVRLDWDSIAFSNQGYGEQLARMEGSPGIIQAIEPIDLRVGGSGYGGGQQVLEFEVFKNIDYRPQMVGNIGFGSNNPLENVYGFRTMATGAYNRVEARAQLVVRFATPQGFEQRKVFRVTVEDYWNLMGSFPPLAWAEGNPFIDPKACLIDNSLDYGSCLNESDFDKKNTYTFSPRQILRVGPNPYSSSYPRTTFGSPLTGTTQMGASAYGNPVSGSQYGGLYQGPGGTPYSYGSTYNQINQPTYAPTTFPQPYPYYAPNYTLPSSGLPYGYPATPGFSTLPPQYTNVCGVLDKVTIDGKSIDQDGVKFTFSSAAETTPNQNQIYTNQNLGSNQSVKLTIDKSKAKKKGEIRLKTELNVTVYRQSLFGVTYLKVPVSVCVNIEKTGADQNAPIGGPEGKPVVPETPPTPNPLTPASFYCPDKEKVTGSDVYNSVFNRLLLNWNWDLGIPDKDPTGKACDAIDASNNGFFCDAVQNTIGLVKKVKQIQTALKESEFDKAIKANESKVSAVLGADKAKESKNTGELARWLKKQVMITDNGKIGGSSGATYSYESSPKNSGLVFFFSEGDENKLLDKEENGKISREKYSGKLKTFDETSGTAKLAAMQDLLSTLSTDSNIDSNAILVLVNNPATADRAILTALGAETITEKTLALTLNEFGYLHQQLKDCIKTGTETSCPNINGQTITKEFLASFANSMDVKYASRHTANLSKDKARIEEKAAWETDITKEKANALLALTKSPVNLMKDNYSPFFRTDFKSHYGSESVVTDADARSIISLMDSKWSFKNQTEGNDKGKTSISEPGQFEAQIKYYWAEQKTEIEFKKAETQPNELQNVLYWLPFDASLRGKRNNSDYGTGFSAATDTVYLNSKQQPLSGSGGTTTLQLKLVENLEDAEARNGKVFKISKHEFLFAPTTPFGLALKLPVNANGVLFNFQNKAELNGKIVWKDFTEGKGSPNTVCKNGKGETQYSVLQQSANGLLYLPRGMTSAVFELVCANPSAEISITQGTVFSQSNGAPKTVSGTANKEKGTAFTFPLESLKADKPINLKDLAEAVKNKQACVKVTGELFELSWNPEYVSAPTAPATTPPTNPPDNNS